MCMDQARAVSVVFLSPRALVGRSSRDTGSTKTQGARTQKVRFREFGIGRKHTICTPRGRERARARVRAPEIIQHAGTAAF